MQSLRMKMNDRAEMRLLAASMRGSQKLGRTGQVARTTVTLGDEEVFIDEMLSTAADTSETVAFQDDEITDARDISDDVVDVLPDMTEDSWEAEDVGQIAFDNAETANEGVDVAMEAAEGAAADALKAQQTADGRNRIYAQAISPVAMPESPFASGDLWYRTEVIGGATRFVEVFMWNGAEWKPYKLVASSLLVPGSVGPVLIEDGGITAPKLSVDSLYGKVLRGNEIYGALIDGSVIRLNGLTDTTTLVSDNGASLTSWSGMNGTTLATDTTVYETGSRSIRGARLVGGNYGVKRTFGFTAAALTAWFRVRVPMETTFVAVLNRYNDDTFTEEAAVQSTTYVVPANTWTWITVTGDATTARLRWRSASLMAVGVQPTSVWIDRFSLIAAADDQRSIEISRATNGSPNIFGYGTTRQQRFSLSTGSLDAAGGQLFGALQLMMDDESRMSSVSPFGLRFGNREGNTLYGFVTQTGLNYDGDLALSAQGKNIRAISLLDVTQGMKASLWTGSSSWNDNKTAGFWYGSGGFAGDPPGAGWILMTITKHEAQGLVIQEARRSLTPTLKSVRYWDGSAWSAWAGDSAAGDTDWIRLDGWTGGFAHSSAPVFYRRRMGYVEFKGGLTNGSWSGALTSFGASMPAGFRPGQAGNYVLPVNSNIVRTANFNADGSIRLYGSANSGAWWVFDMVRYPAEN